MAVPRGDEGQGQPGVDLSKVVVRVIVGCSDYAMESRIHNVAFLAEWEYVRTKQRGDRDEFDRITDLVYKPQFEGVRSDDLHFTIEAMAAADELETDMTTVNERLRTVYHLPTGDTPEYPDLPGLDIVAEVARRYRSETIDELVTHVQRTTPYQNASIDEPIRFRQPWDAV
jgi:hypothetical protein